jgi:hypothetical protein
LRANHRSAIENRQSCLPGVHAISGRRTKHGTIQSGSGRIFCILCIKRIKRIKRIRQLEKSRRAAAIIDRQPSAIGTYTLEAASKRVGKFSTEAIEEEIWTSHGRKMPTKLSRQQARAASWWLWISARRLPEEHVLGWTPRFTRTPKSANTSPGISSP